MENSEEVTLTAKGKIAVRHHSQSPLDRAVDAYARGIPVRRIIAVNGINLQSFYLAVRRSGVLPRRGHGQQEHIKHCINCGDEFFPWANGIGLFCSNECQLEKQHQARVLSGEAGCCAYCEYVYPIGMDSRRKYCSPRCEEEDKRRRDETIARRFHSLLASGMPPKAISDQLGIGSPYGRNSYFARLKRSFCPKCGTQLKKGEGRKDCPKCGWSACP
jgi:hypothetical protein